MFVQPVTGRAHHFERSIDHHLHHVTVDHGELIAEAVALLPLLYLKWQYKEIGDLLVRGQ